MCDGDFLLLREQTHVGNLAEELEGLHPDAGIRVLSLLNQLVNHHMTHLSSLFDDLVAVVVENLLRQQECGGCFLGYRLSGSLGLQRRRRSRSLSSRLSGIIEVRVAKCDVQTRSFEEPGGVCSGL